MMREAGHLTDDEADLEVDLELDDRAFGDKAKKDDEDALVLKGPKVDPLGDSLAARRLRAIARRKAGDK